MTTYGCSAFRDEIYRRIHNYKHTNIIYWIQYIGCPQLESDIKMCQKKNEISSLKSLFSRNSSLKIQLNSMKSEKNN